MSKQVIKYKVIKQSAEMGGKFYGVVDNGSPISAELTMEQIIDKRKLHNYSARQLTVLMEEVLQGAAELVSRDGMPRLLSSLLKFEARIRGTFVNTESGITTQDILVKPRMLKDIKVMIDKDNFTFVNESGDTSPKISGAAQESENFHGWTLADAFHEDDVDGIAVWLPWGALTLSGVRLAPDGWTGDCHWSMSAIRGDTIYRFDKYNRTQETAILGMFIAPPSVASDNVLTFGYEGVDDGNAWIANTIDPTVPASEAYVGVGGGGLNVYTPAAGDKIVFTFARDLGDGSGSVVMAQKSYTL